MRYTKQFQDGGGINLTKAMVASRLRNTPTPEGWTRHTDYHWSYTLNGKRLDYWPTKDKFMYEGKIMGGDVEEFIQHIQQPPASEKGE